MSSTIHPTVIQAQTLSSSTFTDAAPFVHLLRVFVLSVSKPFVYRVHSRTLVEAKSAAFVQLHLVANYAHRIPPFIAREPRPPHPGSSCGSGEFRSTNLPLLLLLPSSRFDLPIQNLRLDMFVLCCLLCCFLFCNLVLVVRFGLWLGLRFNFWVGIWGVLGWRIFSCSD